MGYTTDFDGSFSITPALTEAQAAYIRAFAGSRRMKRDAGLARGLPDPVREAVGLSVGDEGGYFVGTAEQRHGQVRDQSVVEYNCPPVGQPGLWCQWTTEDGLYLEWDGGEKFYNYVEWLQYLIDHFFKPWGCTLSGTVEWEGEDSGDAGRIIVDDNCISISELVMEWTEPEPWSPSN